MNRAAIAALALLLVSGCDSTPKPADSAAATLPGTWTVIAENTAGRVWTATEIADAAAKFSFGADNKLTVSEKEGQGTKTETLAYILSPEKEPKQIVLALQWETGAREVRGIYRIEGDKLFLCTSREGDKNFPAKFEGNAATKTVLLTLQRTK